MATQAALDGQGVVLGTFPFVADEVAAGRLLKPFEIELAPTRRYYILTRPGSRRRPEIEAVCDWLHKEARAYALAWPCTKLGSAALVTAPAPSLATA
jgi:LysR family glycine cleavage system transcriptional activator